jgi:hypothetical protein
LGFAITTALRPDILLIDEVLAMGDAAFQRKCLTRLEDLQAQGVTLLFVSHSMDTVQRLCKRAIWIAGGEVCADGDADTVAGQYLDSQAPAQDKRAPQVGVVTQRRWGNYQAEITRVEFLNHAGVTPPFFKTGDFFRMRIHYAAHVRIDQPTIGLAIYRHDGVHVTGPNAARDGYEIPYIEGEGYVEYTLEYLPLTQGIYEFSAAIYDHESTVPYDHQHRLYPLEIRSRGLRPQEGVAHFSAAWQHVPTHERSGSQA